MATTTPTPRVTTRMVRVRVERQYDHVFDSEKIKESVLVVRCS